MIRVFCGTDLSNSKYYFYSSNSENWMLSTVAMYVTYEFSELGSSSDFGKHLTVLCM